jgi:hypothetical protein
LRKLADSDEIVGIEAAYARHQVVADRRPFAARCFVADVMRHEARARGKNREIGSALALHLELRVLEARPNLVVGDSERRR